MWTLKNIQQTRERNKNKADSHIENKLSVFLKVPSPDINKPNNNNKID